MTNHALWMAPVAALILSVLTGPWLIPVLHKLKFGQEIRDIGPSWHKKKTGTPTMGGFIFIIPAILVTIIFARQKSALVILGFSVVFGLIGFADDYIKVILKRNLGLTERQKSSLQILASLVFVFFVLATDILDTAIYVPFVDKPVALPMALYVIFTVFVIVGASNSVNLTDGVDGLAASVTFVVCLFFALVACKLHRLDVVAFYLANSAALAGFLIYNRHPAKVFMGDTGSLYLGGVVCFGAIMLRQPLLLVVAGGVYVFETLSVIIQVTSFKLTGKRVFKMSPFHHHLEMSGWSENKIVLGAVLATIVLCGVSYLLCL